MHRTKDATNKHYQSGSILRPADAVSHGAPVKFPFSPEEDQRLLNFVLEHGSQSWNTAAIYLGNGRTSRQCRERFQNYLDPKLNQLPFTKEEDELLWKLYLDFGSRWTMMKPFFVNRSAVNLKNHFCSISRKKKKPLLKEQQIAKKLGIPSEDVVEFEPSESNKKFIISMPFIPSPPEVSGGKNPAENFRISNLLVC